MTAVEIPCPTTVADLHRVLDRRNEAFLELKVTGRTLKMAKSDYVLKPNQVLAELKRVADEAPEKDGWVREFLGGVGLITRWGFEDTVTDAGLMILGRAKP